LSYLFIDSTYDLNIGVLDKGLKWLCFEHISGVKASVVIQQKTQEFLSLHGLDPRDLNGIITVNGPGFYTGLRLAEGVADIFEFFGVKKYSFYSYEIPLWCGYTKGAWFTKAYRGEYFIYRWDHELNSKHLYTSQEMSSLMGAESYFIHSETSMDHLSSSLVTSGLKTIELIKSHPVEIFKQVLTGLRRDPFYFRPPEDEFKANP
jgi:tRNA threonylcarbamoyladenosine biosynthesis protein TsaB